MSLNKKTIFCCENKVKRMEGAKNFQMCQHCFQIFPTVSDFEFHQLHTCWHAPFEQLYCKDENCTCLQFWCPREECGEGFVTQFELDYHKKYTCWTTIPFHLSEEELKEKKFVCSKCKKTFATPGLLKHCRCDPEDMYDEWWYWQKNDNICEFQPEYKCTVCSLMFKSGCDYNNHEC